MTEWCFTLWFDNFMKNMDKRKKYEDDTFLRKKTEEKQNSAIIMTSADGKGTGYPLKLKLQVKSFE